MGRMRERASGRDLQGRFDARRPVPLPSATAGYAMIRRGYAHRRSPSVLVLTAVLVSAAPASAAEVARTEGVRLDARDASRTELCLRLTETGSESGGGSGTCGRSPWRPRRSTLISVLNGDRVLAGGAVPASVTRAEAELSDGRRVAFDTVAGPGYHGRQAGKLRFFLAPLPVSDPADDEAGGLVAVRFFGEDGALEGIAGADRLGAPRGRGGGLLREGVRGGQMTRGG